MCTVTELAFARYVALSTMGNHCVALQAPAKPSRFRAEFSKPAYPFWSPQKRVDALPDEARSTDGEGVRPTV